MFNCICLKVDRYMYPANNGVLYGVGFLITLCLITYRSGYSIICYANSSNNNNNSQLSTGSLQSRIYLNKI